MISSVMKKFFIDQMLKISRLFRRKLRWFGHVVRMDDNRAVKMLLFGERADGSRPIGRPKLRFKDKVKALFKVGNLLDVWQEAALDGVGWRSNTVNVCDELNEKRLRSYERRKEKRR